MKSRDRQKRPSWHLDFSLRSLAAGSVLLFLFASPVKAEEQTIAPPGVDARAWILMDYA
ncbi:hypothetical protein MJN47_28055, partial [Salmonella enterica subsp. enterica serovar Lubbock]|nr:hypothetical protein [Salmonella enterica subsp. enterica serovar Lubbock]